MRCARLAGLAVIGLLALPTGASACDPLAPARMVTRGTTPDGVRWEQRAYTEGRRLYVWLVIARPYDDWSGGVSLGLRPRALFVDDTEGFGPDGSDAIVAGVAPRSARRIVVRLSDGGRVTARTHQAPRRALRRYPRLGRLRYWAAQHHSEAHPIRARAYAASGRVVARWPARPPRAQTACNGI